MVFMCLNYQRYQIAIKIANKNIETEIGLDQLEKIDASRKNVESNI